MSQNYLIYDTESNALERADIEGARRGYSYHQVGRGTRYHTYPYLTSNNKYALDVTEYELTEDEQAATTTSVILSTQ